MSKIVTKPQAGIQFGGGKELDVALMHLQTVSAMVQHGSIDTDGAFRDSVTGAFLLPFEGNRHYGQSGFLSLPPNYSVQPEHSPEHSGDPTFSYIGINDRLLGLGRSIFTIYSCRPDVVIATQPKKPLSLSEALNRPSWIGAAAAAGEVAVIKDGTIMGNDGEVGVFSQPTLDLFTKTARAALSVAIEHSRAG